MLALVKASSAANGSSIRIKFASYASTLASEMRELIPPESCETAANLKSLSPIIDIKLSIFSASIFCFLSGKTMFS